MKINTIVESHLDRFFSLVMLDLFLNIEFTDKWRHLVIL